MSSSDGLARREFLKAGVVAGIGLGTGSLFQRLGAQEAAKSKETLDRLLEKYRRHQKTGLHAAGGPGGGNHLSMTLIALYRMGASSDQLTRYGGRYGLRPEAKPIDTSGLPKVTRENWREHLGRAHFLQFVEGFETWPSSDALLKEVAPALVSGVGGAFSHDMIRLGYAIEYDSREEIVYSLAGWASGHRPTPAFDEQAARVEPDELLADIVRNTADLRITPNGGRSGPIAFRLGQVYGSKEFTGSLKPLRLPDADPRSRISELIMESFTRTHDFTLLHVFTTCQALGLVLPFAGDPRPGLTAFWHSACAAFLTVNKVREDIGKDSVKAGPADWKEIYSKAPDSDMTYLSPYEHTIKLAYSCRREFDHYKRDRYLALAAREVEKPSRFV